MAKDFFVHVKFEIMKIKEKKMKKRVVSLLCVLMMVLSMVACGEGTKESPEQNDVTAEKEITEQNDVNVEKDAPEESDVNAGKQDKEITVLGEGKTKFMLTVTDKDGNETQFEINTDKETVGDALLEHELIEGEEGDYGLYIKTVNNITADFEKDQTYWAFYVDGEYATSGVDTTPVNAGSTYSLKVEK